MTMRSVRLILLASLFVGCVKSAPPAESPKAAEAPAESASAKPPEPSGPGVIPANAERAPSGLAWVVLTPGVGGEPAGPDGTVTVHYEGWTRKGLLFDSSRDRGAPMTFPLSRTIPGFAEAVAPMTKGEKRRVWIPAELAYGEHPTRDGLPAGQLTFEIELLDIVGPPTIPEDLATPDATATVLPSGLAYKVLREGTSAERPGWDSLITVHYSGWSKDGLLFDSSVQRGEPFQFRPNQVIPGWSEGVQLMTVGSVYRFWIPAHLAYGDEPKRPGAPAGQLTFDVELIAIE